MNMLKYRETIYVILHPNFLFILKVSMETGGHKWPQKYNLSNEIPVSIFRLLTGTMHHWKFVLILVQIKSFILTYTRFYLHSSNFYLHLRT